MRIHPSGTSEPGSRVPDHELSIPQTAAVLCATSVALLMLNVSPAAEVHLRQDTNYSLSQIGTADFIELAMMGLATLPAYWWLERWAFTRVARWAYAAFVIGNLLSLAPGASFPVYAGARALAGTAAGSLMILGMTCAARARATQRLFAVITAVQQASGAIVLALLPVLVGQGRGLRGFFLLCGGVGMLGLLGARWLPDPGEAGASADRPDPFHHPSQRAIVVFVLAFNMAIGALWAFMGEYGARVHMPQDSLAQVLVGATVIGLAGTAAAYAVGHRYPQRWLIAGALLALLASALVMHAAVQAHWFAVGCLAFSFCWNFCVPNVLAAVARRDPHGRSMLGVNLAFAMGLALGPLAAGVMIESWGLNTLFALAAVALSVSAALIPQVAG